MVLTTSLSEAEFAAATEQFRRELLAHCYRLAGSIHDAEDMVQETYLRAWQALDRFEGRSSVRHWICKIATRVCLTALEKRSRRALPSGLGAPSSENHATAPAADSLVAWLEPAPDTLFGTDDPAAIMTGRTRIRLAFIAALQLLPARQRAVLALRDVLAFSTTETAEILDTTPTAVDSALRRARARLDAAGPVEDDLSEPDEQTQRALLDDYVDAFTRADSDALVKLLRADVELEMPPIPTWFTGQSAVGEFLADHVLGLDEWRLVPTRTNGQLAVVAYQLTNHGYYEGYGVQVLSLIGARISRISAFLDPGLVPTFGFAPALPR